MNKATSGQGQGGLRRNTALEFDGVSSSLSLCLVSCRDKNGR